MRHHDKRPPIRRTVHADQRRWQAYLTQYLCTDERGMRRKARGADRGNEVRNQSGEGEKKTGSECIMKEGRP